MVKFVSSSRQKKNGKDGISRKQVTNRAEGGITPPSFHTNVCTASYMAVPIYIEINPIHESVSFIVPTSRSESICDLSLMICYWLASTTLVSLKIKIINYPELAIYIYCLQKSFCFLQKYIDVISKLISFPTHISIIKPVLLSSIFKFILPQ